jgi:hypothetical protein
MTGMCEPVKPSCRLVEVFGKNAVAIVNQVFVSLFESDSLAQLLQRPSGTWMGGDVAMDQAPAAMLDDHKHVQQTKGRGRSAVCRSSRRRVKLLDMSGSCRVLGSQAVAFNEDNRKRSHHAATDEYDRSEVSGAGDGLAHPTATMRMFTLTTEPFDPGNPDIEDPLFRPARP